MTALYLLLFRMGAAEAGETNNPSLYLLVSGTDNQPRRIAGPSNIPCRVAGTDNRPKVI